MPFLSLTRLGGQPILVNADHVERITPARVWVDDETSPDRGTQVDCSRLWFRNGETGTLSETIDVAEPYGQIASWLNVYYRPQENTP